MNGSLLTASTQNAPETLVAGVHPSSEQQQKTAGGKHASKWAVLSIVAVGVFMATLDSSIVNISLPAIARAFGVPLGGAIEWVIIAYLVVVAGALLTTGRRENGSRSTPGSKPIWNGAAATFSESYSASPLDAINHWKSTRESLGMRKIRAYLLETRVEQWQNEDA